MATVKECTRSEPRISRRAFCTGVAALFLEGCAGVRSNIKSDPKSLANEEKREGLSKAHSLGDFDFEYLNKLLGEDNRDLTFHLRELTYITDLIANNESIINSLRLRTRSSLQILYPAAGGDFTPLDIGVRLQNKFPNIKKVKFVYTEIAYGHGSSWGEWLSATEKDLYPAFKVIGSQNKKFQKGEEITYSLNVFGKTIELTYAIRRSSKGDHDCFKKEYATSSDIVLFHNSANINTHQAETVLLLGLWAALSGKQQVIIGDNFWNQGSSALEKIYSLLPGEKIRVYKKNPHWMSGCDQRDSDCSQNDIISLIYLPDIRKIATSIQEKGFEEFLRTHPLGQHLSEIIIK